MATEAPYLADRLPDTYWPARPEHGVPRLLRRLAGIREDVLDWVPEERPRYTRLGLIVANTGIMAAAAMLIALTSVISVPWAWNSGRPSPKVPRSAGPPCGGSGRIP